MNDIGFAEAVAAFDRAVSGVPGLNLDAAVQVAVDLHDGQLRHGSDLPYVTHPMSVTVRLIEWGASNGSLLSAALLHDVVEDCADVYVQRVFGAVPEGVEPAEVLRRFIGSMFGGDVLRVVDGLTNPAAVDAVPAPGVHKHAAYWEHVASAVSADVGVLLVKCADFVDNAGTLSTQPGLSPRRRRSLAEKYAPVADVLVEQLAGQREAVLSLLGEDGLPRVAGDVARVRDELAVIVSDA